MSFGFGRDRLWEPSLRSSPPQVPTTTPRQSYTGNILPYRSNDLKHLWQHCNNKAVPSKRGVCGEKKILSPKLFSRWNFLPPLDNPAFRSFRSGWFVLDLQDALGHGVVYPAGRREVCMSRLRAGWRWVGPSEKIGSSASVGASWEVCGAPDSETLLFVWYRCRHTMNCVHQGRLSGNISTETSPRRQLVVKALTVHVTTQNLPLGTKESPPPPNNHPTPSSLPIQPLSPREGVDLQITRMLWPDCLTSNKP